MRACPNRCPHEGFPLAEGELVADGTLRCNWHNWTFDLNTGETLVGADRLPQYPVKIEDGRVWLGPLPADTAQTQRRALAGVVEALDDADHARLLRETARLSLAAGDPLDAVRTAIAWLAPRLQYGTTHAIAGAADWIAFADASPTGSAEQLAALGEVLGHIADDGRRERRFPFASGVAGEWEPQAFLAAIEAGDELRALAFVRAALAGGLRMPDLLPTLARAALAHYADFGHSLIYACKSAELAERLGDAVIEPLVCLLVRSFCYATREDLLPEFRAYRAAHARWSPAASARGTRRPPLLRGVSVKTALDTVVAWSAEAHPSDIFRALVDSAAFTLLHVDESAFTTTRGTIAKNANWLDHTHTITFAEAGARVAKHDPDLWPAVLLQMACFLGRSRASVDLDLSVDAWLPAQPAAVLARLRESLVDHGRDRFIISVHLIKTLTSAERLAAAGQADPILLAAALDRFFSAPIKGRHVIRAARQMLAVAAGS